LNGKGISVFGLEGSVTAFRLLSAAAEVFCVSEDLAAAAPAILIPFLRDEGQASSFAAELALLSCSRRVSECLSASMPLLPLPAATLPPLRPLILIAPGSVDGEAASA
jgi:hypothetical protein